MEARSFLKKMGLLATATVALSAGTANAIIIDFYDQGSVFATMTTSGTTTFSLTLGANNNSAAFINDLSMAGPGGTFSDQSTQTVATGTYSATGFVNAGETYNWLIDFPNANNATRLTAGETAIWSIMVTDPSVWSFNLLHINAFDGEASIKLEGCVRAVDSNCTPTITVPEPGTLLLLGAGILGFAVSRRRLVQG